MRLINTQTRRLEDHDPGKTKYAILSHIWGIDEVLFADITDQNRLENLSLRKTAGFEKLAGACKWARQKGFRYVWIDTCCIDKTSSAELSEAINSMCAWYQQAGICVAYLSDVLGGAPGGLEKSRWFKRGWTLQELLAPKEVVFVDQQWQYIEVRSALALTISKIAGIDAEHLYSRSTGYRWTVQNVPIATRMSWMANRETTREEGMAYCLMGIFDVNMPLLYGEGGSKAFIRLQEEILRDASDQSILAWTSPFNHLKFYQLLAITPSQFCVNWPSDAKITRYQRDSARLGMELTPRGLQVSVWICPCLVRQGSGVVASSTTTWLAVLDCNLTSALLERPAILLKKEPNSGTFERVHHSIIVIVFPGGAQVRHSQSADPFRTAHYPSSVSFDETKLRVETILLRRNNVRAVYERYIPLEISVHSEAERLQYIWSSSPCFNHGRRKYDSSFVVWDVSGSGAGFRFWDFQGVSCLRAEAGNTHHFLVWWGWIDDSSVAYPLDNGVHPKGEWVVKCAIDPWVGLSESGAEEILGEYIDSCFEWGGYETYHRDPVEVNRRVQEHPSLLPRAYNSSAEYHSESLHFRVTAKRVTFLDQHGIRLLVEEIV